jgi:hypothetical protein
MQSRINYEKPLLHMRDTTNDESCIQGMGLLNKPSIENVLNSIGAYSLKKGK